MTRKVSAVERMYLMSVEDARSVLNMAGEITGIKYDRRTIDDLAEMYAAGSLLWDSYHISCRVLMECVLDIIKSKKYSFCPLSECVPNVTNEDLLEFILFYTNCSYLPGTREGESEEEQAKREVIYESDAESLLSMMYSGYNLGDWCDLLTEIKRADCCSAIEYIGSYLDELLKKEYIDSSGRLDLCQLSKTARYVRNLRDLVRIILASSFTIDEPIYKLESFRHKYMNMCKTYTCMSESTILRLVDNFIPISFDFSDVKHDYILNIMDPHLDELVDEAGSLSMMYYLLCLEVGGERLYYDTLKLHEEAFDTLSLMITHPDIKAAISDFAREETEKKGVFTDYSSQMERLINYRLDHIVDEVCNSDDVEDAVRNIEIELLSVQLFCEGVLEMLEDPDSKHKLLKRMGKFGWEKVFPWTHATADLLREMSVLARFPRDLAAAAILGMPASEAYSHIVSRGGVHL
jgi:hypothetical protein